VRYRLVERVTQAVTVLLLVGGCGWALITWGPGLACQNLSLFCPPAPGAQELGPFVNDYMAAAGSDTDAEEYTLFLKSEKPLTVAPYRVGLIAAVNVADHAIDGLLTLALPSEIVATRPADVGTVIWVRWGETHEGTYHDEGTRRVSGEAYRGYCAIVVIDLAAGEIVGQAFYEAVSPPTTTTGSGDVHTQVNVESVANWVKTLPVHAAGSTPVPSSRATPTNSPSRSDSGTALEPGESLTLSGDQWGSGDMISEEQFELLAGDYSVVFEGEASKGCANCMAIKVFNERDEYPIFVVNDPDRIAEGRWRFTGVFTLEWWEDGATFHFELDAPKGSWTITLTRDS
jgi:hypothetical protein